MNYSQTFSFKTRNKIPFIQKALASLAVILIGGPVCYYVFSHMILLGPGWMIVILFVTLIVISILLAYILADRNPLDEMIQLDAGSFTSLRYGKVDLNEMLYSYDKTYGSRTNLLEIKLVDDRKIKWRTAGIKDNKTSKETLYDFLEALNNAKAAYKEKDGESFPKNYRFSFIRPAGFLYAVICFLSFPILFIFDDINNLGVWVAPIILAPLVIGMILFIKKTVKKEQVTLFKDYLISKQYGRIDFNTVQTVVTSDSKVSPDASLVLFNEKEIKWGSFNFGSSNKETTARKNMEFWQFTQDLGDLLEHNNAAAVSQNQSRPASQRAASTPIPIQQERGQGIQEAKSASPPPKIKHVRKRKAAYIGIPVGLIVILMVFARHGGMFRGRPLRDAAKNSQWAKQDALRILHGFTRDNGPYFMLTNDHSASLMYYPVRLQIAYPSPADRFEAYQQEMVPDELRSINAGFELRDQVIYAKRHPDSVQWHMTLIAEMSAVIFLEPGFENQTDHTDVYLYVASYTPKIKPAPSISVYRRVKGLSDSVARQLVCAIPIYPDSDLEQTGQLNHLMPVVQTYKAYPETTEIYVIAKAKEDVMSKQRFKSLVAELKQFWKDQDVPMPEFQLKTIE